MSYQELKKRTYDANLAIVRANLVTLTWGNASAADREKGVFAIKPSGVDYAALRPEDMVVLSISTGLVVEGTRRPSSDTPTHWHLYQEFGEIGGIVHTHSTHATAFAQARRDIPCLGTTHADNFYGPVPVTRPMSPEEIEGEYELNTGKVIVECFRMRDVSPNQIPGVLVAHHAPFTWGTTVEKAVENAVVMEFSALMALHTLALAPSQGDIPQTLLDKHYLRKHGAKAYYGQPNK